MTEPFSDHHLTSLNTNRPGRLTHPRRDTLQAKPRQPQPRPSQWLAPPLSCGFIRSGPESSCCPPKILFDLAVPAPRCFRASALTNLFRLDLHSPDFLRATESRHRWPVAHILHSIFP